MASLGSPPKIGNILIFSVFPSPFFKSDEGGVQQQQKNGEGKTEKLKMFPIFGGLPRL